MAVLRNILVVFSLSLFLWQCKRNAANCDITPLVESYKKGDLDKVIQLVERTPEDCRTATIENVRGRALTDLGQFEEAKAALIYCLETSTNIPEKAWALGYLGTVYYALDSIDIAERYLDSCINMNATKNSVEYARKRLKLINVTKRKWINLKTENINFYFDDTAKLEGRVNYFLTSRQEAFEYIDSMLNGKQEKKVDFYVWTNAERANHLLGRQLGFAMPRFNTIHSRHNQSTGHELTHVIQWNTFHPASSSRFVSEGLAVMFDGNRENRLSKAKLVVESDLGDVAKFDVRDIWLDDKNLPDYILYPIAGAFMEYLYSESSEREFHNLLSDESLESAYDIYGERLDSIFSSFNSRIRD